MERIREWKRIGSEEGIALLTFTSFFLPRNMDGTHGRIFSFFERSNGGERGNERGRRGSNSNCFFTCSGSSFTLLSSGKNFFFFI